MPSFKRSQQKRQADFKESAQKCRKVTTYFTSRVNDKENPESPASPFESDIETTASTGIGISSTCPLPPPQTLFVSVSETLGGSGASSGSSTTTRTAPAQQEEVPKECEWYKGMKLDLKWLLENNPCLKQYVVQDNTRSRKHVICSKCEEYVKIAKSHSANGFVPIASVNGIRADSKECLSRIIDHLLSQIHKEVLEYEKMELQWKSGSAKHPWLNCLKKNSTKVINFLIKLAFDVYTDSLLETCSAYSWPARSLTQLAASRFISVITDTGLDSEVAPFTPALSDLHYRDPVHYAEMLECIARVEERKLIEKMANAVVISMQLDGSLSAIQSDNKFLSCRLLSEDDEIFTYFLGVHAPDGDGAEGLLEALLHILGRLNVDLTKIAGITTDGESANTGQKGGLWKLLADHVKRGILTFWCCAHRSDLAIEEMIATVPELNLWKCNLISVATYFRTSKNRAKKLTEIFPEAKRFPRHHEVRFAQHFCNLVDSILHNLDACIKVWEWYAENGTGRKEKAEANGYLKIWRMEYRQKWLTALMGDLLQVFQQLQQQMQRSDLILPDVFTCRDAALLKIQTMKIGPYPGRRESNLKSCNISSAEEERQPEPSKRRALAFNTFVTTGHRRDEVIRSEITLAAENFLSQRLDTEQEQVLISVKNILLSKSLQEFITATVFICSKLFPDETGRLTDEICDSWNLLSEVLNKQLPDGSDLGACLSVKLRNLLPAARKTKTLRKILGAIRTLSPHSMQTERIISHYNILFSDRRTSTKEDTLNNRLMIALNGCGTPEFDPRLAVVEFLKMKERRYREPLSLETFAGREFAVKFFRGGNL